MSKTVISVENLSKSYRLGQIGTGTLTYDLKVWSARVRGKPNPLLKIGQVDHGNQVGETIWALRDVNFQVEQGEVLGIIGRNGAGKSTLLKILSRVTAPTSGCVKVKGRIASLLEVGTGFHPDLTGRENIYLNGAILGMTKEEVRRKFDEIVDFAEIEKFIDTPVKRYSSGMYVRLAFAVAAHLESEILLVDEVLAVGDAEFQKKCLGKMGDVASNEGRTILFVSHNMGAILNLCQKSLLINAGIIQASGLSNNTISEYLTMNQASDNQDLVKHPNRKKGSIPILKSISLIRNNINSGEFYTGDIFTGKISIIITPNILQNAILGFSISDINGYRVFSCSMNQNETSLKIIPGKTEYSVNFKIPELILSPGQYSLSLYIGNSNYDLDVVEQAVFFHVFWNSSNGLPHSPLPHWGPAYMPVDWQFEQ